MSLMVVDAKQCPVKDGEVWMLVEIETHPQVLERDPGAQTKDRKEMYNLFKKFFEKLPYNKDHVFLVGKLGGKVAGFLGIHRKSRSTKLVGDVGIAVHPDFWNRGFGSELLKAGIEYAKRKGFSRLEAITFEGNAGMIRIAEKVGFKCVGVRRKRTRTSGTFQDLVLLGMDLR